MLRKEHIRKSRSRRLALVISAAVLSMGLLSACGSTQESAQEAVSAQGEEASGELKEVTLLLDWTPNVNHTGFYVARDQGYYEEAGLNVDITVPAEETATQLVAVGKGEFGIGNTEDTIHAVSLEDPMPVTSIAAIVQHNTSGFVSLKEAGIESPADWEGKTYGGYGGTTEEKIVRSIAEENGVDPDSIHFVDLGNSDTLTALQNEIDFIWVFESTELISLAGQGVEYNYIPVRDCGEEFDYYTPVLIANNSVLNEDPEMVQAFLQATARGYDYAIEHPEEAAEILLNAEPELDTQLISEGQEYLSERYTQDAPQWGWQDEAVWQRYEDFLYQNGLIENEVDVNTVFTTEYLPES